MEESLPVNPERMELQNNVDIFSQQLSNYLQSLDLPIDDVLVQISERRQVLLNMPSILSNLRPEQQIRAYYISKFIASCVIGLFDAALNYLWNETIVNLREKIIHFDLNYFFDSTISGNDRAKFITEEDLLRIEDWQLIKGCRDTGIISNIGFMHLDFIRNMRNFASAAHPNQTQLTGIQLASWLDTCIREVLAKEPSGPVIEIKRLLKSLREETLDERSTTPINANILKLPADLVHSLLRTIFGMYTDEKLSQNTRNNINLISKTIWEHSETNAKEDIGLKYAHFSIHAELKRKELAREFLTKVGGLSFLSEDQLAIEMNERLESLLKAHYDFNNFYTEEPHARALSKLIPETGIIPDVVRYLYVKALIICRLGNPYGISLGAKPYYDLMIQRFRDVEIIEFLNLLNDSDILSIIQYEDKSELFSDIALKLEDQTVDEVIISALRKIRTYPKRDIVSRKAYKEISKTIS